jgi:hypothetical protein
MAGIEHLYRYKDVFVYNIWAAVQSKLVFRRVKGCDPIVSDAQARLKGWYDTLKESVHGHQQECECT